MHDSTEIGKVKIGIFRAVQKPGSYWDRSSALPLVRVKPTAGTAYDSTPNLLTTRPPRTEAGKRNNQISQEQI